MSGSKNCRTGFSLVNDLKFLSGYSSYMNYDVATVTNDACILVFSMLLLRSTKTSHNDWKYGIYHVTTAGVKQTLYFHECLCTSTPAWRLSRLEHFMCNILCTCSQHYIIKIVCYGTYSGLGHVYNTPI